MNDTDRPELTVRSKVIGSLLLGLGAGAFVVTLWAAIGALLLGTTNSDPPLASYPEPEEPLFSAVKWPVLGTIIALGLVGLGLIVAAYLVQNRVWLRRIGFASLGVGIGGIVVLGALRLQTHLWAGSGEPMGSGLSATRRAWELAGCSLILLMLAPMIAGLFLGERPWRAGLIGGVVVAVVGTVVVGLPQTYSGAVKVVKGDLHDVTAPLPDRIGGAVERLAGDVLGADAIGPGYFAGLAMYNGDTGTERWRLDISDSMYSSADSVVYPDAGVVVVTLERPDGTYETHGIDASTGDRRWKKDDALHTVDPLDFGPADAAYSHLIRGDPSSVITVSSPGTGEKIWEYTSPCRILATRDGPFEIDMYESCDDESMEGLRTVDAKTGKTIRVVHGDRAWELMDWQRHLGPIRDRYEPRLDDADSGLVLRDKKSGEVALSVPRWEGVACNAAAECLWSGEHQTTTLTSLAGAFDDIVFDWSWSSTSDRGAAPAILADQAIWISDDATVAGDRSTGEVTTLAPYEADRYQQRSPAPVPGGVLISDEAIARNAIVKAAK